MRVSSNHEAQPTRAVGARRAIAVVAALCALAAAMTILPFDRGTPAASAAGSGGIDNVIPRPASVREQPGELQITSATRIVYETRDHPMPTERSLQPLARVLAGEIELITGIRPALVAATSGSAGPGDIHLGFQPITDPAPTEAEQDQSYLLDVTDRAVITSPHYKGVAYGTTTLTQALIERGGSFTVPGVRVEDRPANAYRAVMVDIARQRHSVDTLREIVDLLRQYKTRYLHLHLTDDQNFVFPFGPVTDNLANNYTISRQDFLDLVAYADARGVTIIPELDLPGHSTKLIESGYIDGSTHRDVASPANYRRIEAIVDDMASVFASSPYFHIGGDESSAGSELVPFLAEINRHVRSLDLRLLVWEGFHGAPASIPATGPDRVVVMSWESSYNAPWDLLESGYEVINASWMPMYVVGHGTPLHPGTGGRRWSPEVMHRWDADSFMHWQPGRPVFDDRGPNDPDRTDSTWRASYIGRQDQVQGGTMLFWEQAEWTVVDDLRERLPVMAERLWNPSAGSYADHRARFGAIDDRVMTMVRPIEILPDTLDPDSPITGEYRIYQGDSVDVILLNRSRIDGTIRYEHDGWDGSYEWIYTGPIPAVTPASPAYGGPIELSGGFGIRAQLYRSDGTAVGGTSLATFNNWPQTVHVVHFRVDRDEVFTSVPDTELMEDRRIGDYRMPVLRGPMPHNEIVLERHTATLRITEGGRYTFALQTQHGRANFHLDLDGDGVWDPNERIIDDTPSTEQPMSVTIELRPGDHRIRVDHLAGMPRVAMIAAITGPDTGGRRSSLNPYLVPLADQPPPPPPPPPPTDVDDRTGSDDDGTAAHGSPRPADDRSPRGAGGGRWEDRLLRRVGGPRRRRRRLHRGPRVVVGLHPGRYRR